MAEHSDKEKILTKILIRIRGKTRLKLVGVRQENKTKALLK